MSPRRLISFDWAMKKLLRSKANFEILEGFLSELLKQDIQVLEILESESNKENNRDKFNRVDLKVKNQDSEIIIIEVQHEREFDYLERILYGTSKVITEHLNENVPYGEIVKVISVNILYFDLGQGEDYVYHGTTTFKGLHTQDLLELSEDQQGLYKRDKVHHVFLEYYLIKVNNFNDIAKDTLDEWIYFLKNREIKDNFVAKGLIKAKQELDILKLPEQERSVFERYQDDLHYQASIVDSSYGIGKIKGRKEGREEVREEGKREERINMAMNLLDILDDKVISEKTGLSLEEVQKIRERKL